MNRVLTGSEIRQGFIDFFKQKGHIVIPSASLVPGGDQTLLFTNAGMVQFKDVFLGTDHRPYKRAVDSQKCMRVAGKHNDLDDVGRDDSHHTFFEMLGNWSFGDYYKKEAIAWAWELLTEVWGLDKGSLWTTCFKDDKGDIPSDADAASVWRKQPGINPEHILFFGRKENFWEMADTGPCGPCSEIHIDLGPEYCNKKQFSEHVCRVNGDCRRFLELWNLVFIQYNRINSTSLEPLPATHVDTGMGFERIVSVLQRVYSNYKTDLLMPIIETVRELSGNTVQQRDNDFTPYRVIADHSRAAAFLIADGVVPGNTGRNYVCRMIIRRASRFGEKLGLVKPFLAQVVETTIKVYSEAYPELIRNRSAILTTLTREEERFHKTVEEGVTQLADLLSFVKAKGDKVLDGQKAFDLYATHGLPLEITRDIAREQGLDVDELEFRAAMEEHKLVSGAGKAFGPQAAGDVGAFRNILVDLVKENKLPFGSVLYDPYDNLQVEGEVLALVRDGIALNEVSLGDQVAVVLPITCFYIESGGQVSDVGKIVSLGSPGWEVQVDDVRRPASGIIVHIGRVVKGTVRIGDFAKVIVDSQRRKAIMRNHTATHLLHAELNHILGDHARQAGSLVAPDRLRFDFSHPVQISSHQLDDIEARVNQDILQDYILNVTTKPLAKAIEEGATAIFGEKYGEIVRTISIGNETLLSYELCGGTHVKRTGDIGSFIILNESSVAAGIRRIEAVTGQAAYEIIQHRLTTLKETANLYASSVDEVLARTKSTLQDLELSRKQVYSLREQLVSAEFTQHLDRVSLVNGTPVLALLLTNADVDTMRQMTDRFRQRYTSGVVVLGSAIDGRPSLIAAITENLVEKGISAGDLVKNIAQVIGGSGGGRPILAQAGGKDAGRLQEALDQVIPYLQNKLA